MRLPIISAKYTEEEIVLLDDLLDKTGAGSRSAVLRLGLLLLAEDQRVHPTVIRKAQASRLNVKYRPLNPGHRAALEERRAKKQKQEGRGRRRAQPA